MKLLKAGACALALLTCAPAMGGCANMMHGAPVVDHQTAERAMIDCNSLYIAIATIANSGLLPADKQLAANHLRDLAWDALQGARKLYAANDAPSIATLTALLIQAQALAGQSPSGHP